MIHPTADPHGVLLQRPEPRQGLASVADPGLGALHRVYPGRSGRCDAGKVTYQIEQSALSGEQSAGGCLDSQQGLPGLQSGAVGDSVQNAVAVRTEDSSSTIRATSTPAATLASRATTAASVVASSGTVAAVVTSGP